MPVLEPDNEQSPGTAARLLNLPVGAHFIAANGISSEFGRFEIGAEVPPELIAQAPHLLEPYPCGRAADVRVVVHEADEPKKARRR